MTKNGGLFISFEGGEGAGKSTQIAKLEDALRAYGHRITRTREPGGSNGAEEIRALMVSGATDRWDAMTELLLANAARRDHIVKTILPALEQGHIVLCDRFVHSTLAYQAGRDGVTDGYVAKLHKKACKDLWPDMTFVFDIDPQVAMARANARDGAKTGRFEKMGDTFHSTLRHRFLSIAKSDDRCILIDADQSIEALAQNILSHVGPMLHTR